MLLQILVILQLLSAVLLILVILLQQKGSGLGAAFGGGGNIFTTKRGIDAVLFKATIVIALIFFGISLLRVIL